MSNEDVKIKVGAEDTGVAAKFAEVKETVNSAVEGIQSKIESLSGAFSKLNEAFLAVTAVLAGGEAFKEAIDSTVAASFGAEELGRQLGITAEKASVMKVAMDENFVSADALTTAQARITQTMRKNEPAFDSLGVKIRDSNGHLRNSVDVMQDVNAKLLTFKEGTDRNVEAQMIYGKSWASIEPIIKITGAAMQEAQDKADSLGLTVGQRSVAQALDYKTTMVGVHDVLEGLERAIGNALLPVLTSMGKWFESVGPQAVTIMRDAMLGLVLVFEGLKAAVLVTFDWIQGAVQQAVIYLVAFGTAANKAMHLDFTGARASWQAGMDEIDQISATAYHKMEKDGQAAVDAVSRQMETAFDKDKPDEKKGSTGTSEGGDGGETLMAKWQAELAIDQGAYEKKKLAQGSFEQFSNQMTLEYWQKKLAITAAGSTERAQVAKLVGQLEYKVAQESYTDEIATLRAKESAYKGNLEAKLAIAKDYAARVARAEGSDSSQAAQAHAQVLAIENQVEAQKTQIAKIGQAARDKLALSGIKAQEQGAQADYRNHLLTFDQLLAAQRQFEDQRYAIEQSALERELRAEEANPDRNPVKIAQLNAQKLALQTQYNAAVALLNQKAANDQNQIWKKTFDSLQSGFQHVIGGFLKGTETFRGAIIGLFKSVVDAVISTLAQMAAQWLTTTIAQAVQGRIAATGIIAGHAAEAGAAAFAATAAIPMVGPALAPAVAAASYAETMAFQASAAGGYDIPAGVNPIVQTHAQEMILPQKHADVIRGLADNGGGTGAGGARHVHLNLNAMDGRSAKQFFKEHSSSLAEMIFGEFDRFNPALR